MSKYLKQGLPIALMVFSALSTQTVLAQSQPAEARPNTDIDTRRGIVVRPNERTRILSSMRNYLVGLQKLTEALARDDMNTAAEAARSMGSINVHAVHLMFPNKSAVEFRELAFEVHQHFDRIATDAQEKKDPKLMLGQVSAIMKKCAYCHDTYRLQDTAH